MLPLIYAHNCWDAPGTCRNLLEASKTTTPDNDTFKSDQVSHAHCHGRTNTSQAACTQALTPKFTLYHPQHWSSKLSMASGYEMVRYHECRVHARYFYCTLHPFNSDVLSYIFRCMNVLILTLSSNSRCSSPPSDLPAAIYQTE